MAREIAAFIAEATVVEPILGLEFLSAECEINQCLINIIFLVGKCRRDGGGEQNEKQHDAVHAFHGGGL